MEMNTKVVLKNVRLSYANIWEPKETLQGDMKYSVSLIIGKDDKGNLSKIKKAIEAAKVEGKSKLANKKGVVPSNLKTPLRDGDADRPDDEAYAGCYFMNANANPNHPPKIVDRMVDPITDRDEVYSGCYANVAVNFYAFSASGNIGIACGLGNIQKTQDGERLSGGSTAEEDFEAIESDEKDEFLD